MDEQRPHAVPEPREIAARGVPLEVQPRHAPAHTVGEFLFQLLTITAGVLIALAVDGLVEWKHNRELVREATATITREVSDNKAALERHLADADTREKDVDNSLQLANQLLATKTSNIHDITLGFHLSSMSAAAWQTAERTGAVAHMEYAAVQKYAKLYNLQTLYEGEQRRVMEQVVAALSSIGGDPHEASPADLDRFRRQLFAVRGMLLVDRQLADGLLKSYKETLGQ